MQLGWANKSLVGNRYFRLLQALFFGWKESRKYGSVIFFRCKNSNLRCFLTTMSNENVFELAKVVERIWRKQKRMLNVCLKRNPVGIWFVCWKMLIWSNRAERSRFEVDCSDGRCKSVNKSNDRSLSLSLVKQNGSGKLFTYLQCWFDYFSSANFVEHVRKRNLYFMVCSISSFAESCGH